MPIKKSEKLWSVWCEVCGFKAEMTYAKALKLAFAHKKGYHYRTR